MTGRPRLAARLGRQTPAIVAIALGAATFLVAAAAWARPGGGHSYSGSHSSGGGGFSGSSGGGGGGGGGFLFYLLFDLCINHPTIGVPLLIIVVIVFVLRARSADVGAQSRGWATGDYSTLTYEPEPVAATQGIPRSALDQIRQTDPDFSVVVFEDFLYVLYAEMQRARGQQGAMALAAYLSPQVQQAIAAHSLRAVSGIVVGAMRVFAVERESSAWRVAVDFEANLTEEGAQAQRRYVVDRLVLLRAFGAKSRPPARARTLDCPNCGAPLQNVRGDVCSYCKQQVGMGRFDWNVVRFERLTEEARPPLLTSDVEEQGTNLPTVRSPQAPQMLAQLKARDPSFEWNAFLQRVGLIFQELQVGWSSRDLSRARPFVSDNLFQSQAYWIDLYLQAHARNVTENARITGADLATVLSDKYFDSITVRLFATGLDYTISDDGKVLSGSRHRERPYSEYWTLIRSAGKTGPTHTTPNCPNCGAPLKINQAGLCGYCNVKVTTGDFDWVLSRIEQDDSYTG